MKHAVEMNFAAMTAHAWKAGSDVIALLTAQMDLMNLVVVGIV